MYQIAKDSRSSSRSGSIAPLCDGWRDTEEGREDEQDGTFFDRNCLRFARGITTVGMDLHIVQDK